MTDPSAEKKKRPEPSLELLATLYTLEQLEEASHDMPQLALAGRSNVGKSSLINALARRKKLAKVSSEPGKTRSVNLFKVLPDGFCLTDLPGYGYARRGHEERRNWAALIQTYLEKTRSLRALVLLLAVVVLCRIVAELASDELTHTVGLCAALGAAGVLLPPLAGLIGKASAVTEAIGVFLLAAVPVYAGLLVTAGNAVTGATYGALTLAAANGVSALTVNLFVPLLRVFLALSAVSSVTSFDLKKLTDALYKLLKWALVLAVTVFTGILSVQTLVSAQSDAVTGKAARMIASCAIPIVGGAFGDAFSVLGASIGMIKSGVGAFGILASLAIFLPLCLQAAVWLGVCFLSSLAAALFSLSKLAAFLDGCATALKLLLAVVFSIGAVSVVSAAVVLCVRGAYA